MGTKSVHHDTEVEKPISSVGHKSYAKKLSDLCSIFLPSHFWKFQVLFWTKLLPGTWNKLSFDQKIAWIVFGSYTLTLLTLIEMFALKK